MFNVPARLPPLTLFFFLMLLLLLLLSLAMLLLFLLPLMVLGVWNQKGMIYCLHRP